MFTNPGNVYHRRIRELPCALMTLVALVACGACSQNETPKPQIPARVAQAVKEARMGMGFWRSRVCREPLSAEEADAAEDYVRKNADVSSYHLLMALREHAPNRYARLPDATKALVLCDALARVAELNEFGLIDFESSDDRDSAKALLEVGRPAIGPLRGLLSDRSEARLSGSQEATVSARLKYRRADFAYRYIMLILGRRPTFADELEVRDKLIAELENELSMRDKESGTSSATNGRL